jgi:hypothetical protein
MSQAHDALQQGINKGAGITESSWIHNEVRLTPIQVFLSFRSFGAAPTFP